MQKDCNFLIYTEGGESSGKALWDTGTHSTTKDDANEGYLVLQNDGNLAVYSET